MTNATAQRRLRDLPRTSLGGRVAAVGAAFGFAGVGAMIPGVSTALQTGAHEVALALALVLLVAMSLANLWVVDRELREVSA